MACFRGEGEKKINAFLPSAAFLPPPIHFSILAERSISAYNCVSKAKMPGVSKTNIQFNPFLSTATRAPWPFALRASLIVFFWPQIFLQCFKSSQVLYFFILLNCIFVFFSQLSDGSLEDNCIVDGSRITLLPRAETGLLVSYFASTAFTYT